MCLEWIRVQKVKCPGVRGSVNTMGAIARLSHTHTYFANTHILQQLFMRLGTRVESLDELHGTTFTKCSYCVAANRDAGFVRGAIVVCASSLRRSWLRRCGRSGELLGQDVHAGDSLRPLEGSRSEFRAEREVFILQKGCLRVRDGAQQRARERWADVSICGPRVRTCVS